MGTLLLEFTGHARQLIRCRPSIRSGLCDRVNLLPGAQARASIEHSGERTTLQKDAAKVGSPDPPGQPNVVRAGTASESWAGPSPRREAGEANPGDPYYSTHR